jgi:ubiquitin conjugation factor E4 B
VVQVPLLNLLFVLQLFTGAAGVLRAFGGLPIEMIDDFEALGVKSKAQAQEMMDAEALLGDIPDEFLDPIQVALLLNCLAIYFF